jgi:cation/acetate symporter
MTVKALPLIVFGAVLAVTIGVTFWASRRTRSSSEFWAAGRSISPLQNGLAISGDYMSAAAFLGVTGLMFLGGFDGFITGVAAICSFIPVMLLLAERMRNSGKYTMADVLAFRLRERPARTAAAIGTLFVVGFYLIAQMIAAGSLIEALAGLSFPVAVLITGAAMLLYVLLGGMLATTWVQIIKAVLLMGGVLVLALFVLAKFGWDPIQIFNTAKAKADNPAKYLAPGGLFTKPLDAISIGIAFALGTAGLPHILMRFFTVPTGKAARGSVGWAIAIIGIFYVLVSLIGFGSRAVLGAGGDKLAGDGGNLAAPYLAQSLGGGSGTAGGDVFFAVISGVAFATILAVVAGLVIAASGGVAHDLWSHVIKRGRHREGREVLVGKIAAGAIGVLAIGLALVAGKGFNVQLLVGLAFSVAASANFPSLVLALFWRRFNTAGALTGVAFGLIASIGLIVLSPPVWAGPDSHDGAPFPLQNPALLSIPIGFLGCWLGTVLSSERTEARHRELRVRAETGVGAET